jgi:hypothetical protein
MSNQGTIRLKVTNDAPAIEKLWNGRFRLEFLCDNNSPKTDWYSENISSILPEYGILQDTNFGSGVSEDWEAIPASVYPDMRLVETEYVFIPTMGDKRVKLTYETLTASWVEEKDEDTDYELNGLKRVSRTFVALPDTAYDKVVGTSTIDSNGTTLYLGSFKIEETDAKWSLSESWLEAGELSREENSEDAKGSISITQIGGCPAAPAGYTAVNESKNNTQGFETCSRTFYKDDSELSRSNDYVGSQLAETIEVFSPTVAPTPTNGTAVLGNKSTSNVDGIPTTRYTFLVPSVLSESSDKIGSQSSITIEAFNETPETPTGYVIASEQASDVEGIPTTRYTFLKPSVLSRSEDKIGSQLAIVIEAFSEVPETPSNYVLANKQISEFEGVKTNRYTFLEPSILSRSEDKVGSQLAITIEAFSEVPETPTSYSLANKQVSDVAGIPTTRYTFLKPSILNKSSDRVGSQLAITIEAFEEIPETPTNYSLANTQESDYEGIKTSRYTFLKPSVLSRSEDRVGSQLAITIEAFEEIPDTPAEYVLAGKQVSNFEGIKTNQYTFLKENVELSRSEDKVGSQLAIVIEQFNGIPITPAGYVVASEQVSDVEGIPTKRYTFLKPSILSQSEDKVGSQLAITIEAFEETPATPSGYVIANTRVSDVEGIPTTRYTFLKPSILSKSSDKIGSQLAVTIEAFGEIPETPAGYVLANEQVSDFEGINTTRYTFLKPSILSEASDKVGSQVSIVIEAFNLTPNTPASYVLANTRVSDVAGIPTKRYTFLKGDVELSRSEDKVGSQLAIVIEQFNGIPITPTGYSIASTQESDVEGIPTKRYTFLKDNVELSRSEDKVGSQLSININQFNGIPATPAGYVVASEQVSDFEGIPTRGYTFLKPSILSQSEDRVGSQLAITIEAFEETPATPSDYVIANTQTSDVDGIPTTRYTFLKPSILSKSSDRVGSQLAITIEAFGEIPVAPAGYVLANTQESDYEGIKTSRYIFLKEGVLLSETEDMVGSQLAKVQEWFNLTVDPTIVGYVIGNVQRSDVGGIPTKRYTFLKDGVLLSETEDKVGSQLAIVQERFNPTEEPTIAGYVIANVRVSDYMGIPTKQYTFLRDDVELSRSKDKVGSQVAIIVEQFAGIPDTPAGYTIANEQISNVEGIPTTRYTFLKSDVELFRNEDKVGSQLAIIIEQFDGIPNTPANYSVANKQISNFEGISTNKYTFLKPSILTKTEDRVGSQLAIAIEAFGEVPATPAGYFVASIRESDVEGIPTKRYTFLKPSVLSRTDINDGSRMAIVIEAFEEVPAAIGGYALTNTQVSDVEGIPTNRYTFLKEGLLSESAKALSDGLTKKSYTWLGTAGNESGVLVGETIGNYQGIQTITREYMVLPTGFGSSFDYESTVPFTIPGTVTTEKKDIGGGKNLILITTPPVQTTCVATVKVSYSTDSTPSTSGLYQPDSWSSAIVSGIGYNYRPISYTNTMSNYIRIGSGDTIIRADDGGSTNPPQALMGQFLYIDVVGRIELTGPTDDPAGDDLLLSVSVDPVFSSITGTQYYKTTKVTAKVPARG